jgi:hypothetical protein
MTGNVTSPGIGEGGVRRKEPGDSNAVQTDFVKKRCKVKEIVTDIRWRSYG